MADCGLGACFLSEEKQYQRRASRAIDRQLEKDKTKYRRMVKILLLGSGESGKSTFLKQMRIIHGNDFVADELKQFKIVIYGNIVKGMKVLIDAHDKLHIPWGDNRNVKAAGFIFGYDVNVKLEEPVFQQFVPYVVDLWKDDGIRTTFDRRREFQLGDSIKYFLDNVERIGQMGYTPTTQDVLLARKATKGISEHEFLISEVPFCFVDVGGQRSQRQRWYQCFDNVKSILFLASSSEFDQVLFEDRRTNRLLESCNIFDTIANNRAFDKVSIILFLNKTDLLEEKIKGSDIKHFFPQFSGDSRRLADVQQFELSLFDQRRVDRSQPLFHHFTTAIDTQNIKFVFQAVKDTILRDNLKTLMLQ